MRSLIWLCLPLQHHHQSLVSFIFLHLYPPETKCLRFVTSSGISQSRLFALTFHRMGRMYLYMYTAEHQINNAKEGSVKLNLWDDY